MKPLKLIALSAAWCLALGAGVAHAQGSTGPGAPVLVGSVNAPELRGPDETALNIDRAREEAVRRANNNPKSSRAVAAKPEDVVAGSEVRDSKGAVLGTIESVSMSAAVVTGSAGKVEVPLESFGKNNKGLLIGVTKAEFDRLVADANKPAD